MTVRPYEHFCIPGPVPGQTAVDRVDQAVVSLPGWSRVTEPDGSGEVTGYYAWVHAGSGVELLMVIVRFEPLILSIGSRYALQQLFASPERWGWEYREPDAFQVFPDPFAAHVAAYSADTVGVGGKLAASAGGGRNSRQK